MSFNDFVVKILHSPFHWLLSNRMMVLTVTGRKSGTRYTMPVEYYADGSHFLVLTRRERRWWKNLRGGAKVSMRLRNCEIQGYASVATKSAVTTRYEIGKLYTFLPSVVQANISNDSIIITIDLMPA